MRTYTCLVCRSFKISIATFDKIRIYDDVCLQCQDILNEFNRLFANGIVKKIEGIQK